MGIRMNKIFLIFFFSILIIFLIFVSAEEDCIFNYVKVDGDTICQRNCSESLIISKERNNIILTPKPDVTIKYYPTPQYNQQPTEKWINNSLYIIQPIISNYGYYYWILAIDKPERLLRLIVLSYDEYENKCVKKEEAIKSQNETKSPQLPPEEGDKNQSNESQSGYGSGKEEVETRWNFWTISSLISKNWSLTIFLVLILMTIVIIAYLKIIKKKPVKESIKEIIESKIGLKWWKKSEKTKKIKK